MYLVIVIYGGKVEKLNNCRIFLIIRDENIGKRQIFNIQVSLDISVSGILKFNFN